MQQEIAVFFDKIEDVIKSKLPFVVYRKPNEDLVKLLVQDSNELNYIESFLEEGFVFSPFDKNEKKIIFRNDGTKVFSIELEDSGFLNISEESGEVEIISTLNEDQKKHIALAQKTIDFIHNKKADKIVVSRKEEVKSTNLEIVNSFKKMLKNYQNAMVYVWFHPKVGCWMGASPERLIHVKNGVFKTMALAGTQSYVDTKNVIWKTKELEEQQFVTDYIIETIKGTINGISISDPYTVKAGNLLHLRTDISGGLKSEQSLEQLINALHPTPAVCGLPKQIATNFIKENEYYNRSFYTGFLGELHQNDETNLYVNLRCMEIEEEKISIFIGGGITKDSVAEKEWNETVNKSKVMKKVL